MPDFGPCALRYISPTPLVAVIDRVSCDGSGAVSNIEYWNHATKGWEAGPMEPRRHVTPLIRLAEDGLYSRSWVLFLPYHAFGDEAANAAICSVDASGGPGEVIDNVSCLQGRMLSSTI